MVARLDVSRIDQLAPQIGNARIVLCMHHDHAAGPAHRLHRGHQDVIGQLEAVGHVGLERRAARRDDFRDFGQGLGLRVQQRHVQAEVDHGVALGLSAACASAEGEWASG